MPAGDGTGPRGVGPMTGRGAGYCAGYDAPGYASPIGGRGMGWRRGGGRGWRHRSYATGLPGWGAPGAYDPYPTPPTREQETEFLKAQADALKQQLDVIGRRISELEKEE